MTPPIPSWLASRGGGLRPTPAGHAWAVLIDGRPLYLLGPYPVAGKYSCKVEQTNNGRRLDSGGLFATPDAALTGGLEELRKVLGW